MTATIRDHLRAIIDTTAGFPRARAEAALDLLEHSQRESYTDARHMTQEGDYRFVLDPPTCIHGVAGCTMGKWMHGHIGPEFEPFRCPKCGKQGSICSASTRDECVNWRESNRA